MIINSDIILYVKVLQYGSWSTIQYLFGEKKILEEASKQLDFPHV